jgi:hypothetical protein
VKRRRRAPCGPSLRVRCAGGPSGCAGCRGRDRSAS